MCSYHERRKCRHHAAMLHPRCDGEIGGGTDNHAVNLGVRFSR
jgi:hypothetical protein